MPSPVSLAVASTSKTCILSRRLIKYIKHYDDYGIVFIQPQCKMDLELAQRMTRDYTDIVRSIYITNDQVIVCFQTNDTLLQTVRERYKVGLFSTLYDPIYPSIWLDVGYNTARSQVEDEVLQEMAYSTISKKSPENLIHLSYLYVNPEWKSDVQTKLSELPSTEELDELAKLLWAGSYDFLHWFLKFVVDLV